MTQSALFCHDIYAFDASDTEFPEPIGHFDNEKEKIKFIRKKILLQDTALYLGSVYKKFHSLIYQKHNELPKIELKRLAIDYNEIYRKAMEDYIAALVTGGQHAVTASFVLPSLIEQGLGMALQSRMLFKCIMQLNDLEEKGKKVIEPFLHNDEVLFNGTEKYTMEKLYRLFVAKGVLKNASDNEMILTGVGQKGKRKLSRTLGSLLNSNFAKEEILPEYLELLKNFFIELNIRNCIMHGLGETFDYLDIGLVSIMFQLLWDIVDCEIFKDS